MSDTLAELEAQYCPPIDPALFSAIASDYDLQDESALQEARATLDSLKASALEEAATDFDPSGSGATDIYGGSHSRTGTDILPSNESDLTSVSNDLSSLDLTEPSSDADNTHDHEALDLDSLDEQTKLSLLKDVFPNTSDFTISHTLKKCNNNWKQALDDLLNQVYFSEAGDGAIFAKSIDAFSEDNIARRGRKGKRKGNRSKALDSESRSSSISLSSDAPISTVNKWQTASEDVEFIASRSGISAATVKSVYNSNGASVSETIGSLLRDTIKTNKQITSVDPTIQANAVELGHDFPTIASDYLAALIRITHPSTASAHELAKALLSKKAIGTSSGPLIPQYERPLVSDDEYEVVGTKKSRSAASSASRAPLGMADAYTRASSYSNARHAALAQAQAAYRRSKSDRLMAGAAGYYSQVGREHAAASQKYTSAAADALVDSQSTANQLDLHGITVQDALRISRNKVEHWWSDLGESRVNGRRGADDRARGFSIVTGVGRHSEGGKAKIGPAVSRMLTSEGWRIEAGGGVILVKGRTKA